MESQSLIALASLVLAVPSAWISYRDLTGNRYHATQGGPPTTWAPPAHGTLGIAIGMPQISAGTAGRLSLPRRLLSTFVDMYAVIIAGVLVAAILTGGRSLGSEDLAGADWLGIAIAWTGLVWMSSINGRSPGRLLVGGRLVPADDLAGRVPFATAAGRSLLGAVLNLFFLVSTLAAAISPMRQSLHDRATSTRVIKTR